MRKNQLSKEAKKVLAVITAASMAGSPSVYAAGTESPDAYVTEDDAWDEASMQQETDQTAEAAEAENPADVPTPEVSDGAEAPVEEETPAVTETEDPMVTETPEETEEPTVTEIPQETEEPTVTETPAETEEPTVTETPVEKENPTVTETEDPAVTDIPAETEDPTVTDIPAETEEPTVTDIPAEMEDPTVTEVPEETEALTPTPTVTVAPENDIMTVAEEIQDGWVQEGDNWCYYQNGEKLTDTEVDAYDEASGKSIVCRVDADGNRLTSAWYEDSNGYTYYYGANGGRAEGFTEIDGVKYYFYSGGNMAVDTTVSQYDSEAGKYKEYRFDGQGHIYTGWYTDEWDEIYYYGADGVQAEGVTVIDGETYYFDDCLITDYTVTDNGYLYHFGENGKMEAQASLASDGWVQLQQDWYYAKDGNVLKSQFVKSGSYTYYMGGDGAMYKDTSFGIWDGETGGNYYCYRVDKEGHLVTGWYITEWNDKFYYDSEGRQAKGLTVIDGETYYFDPYSVDFNMVTDYSTSIDGYLYHFGADGKMDVKKSLDTNGWAQIGNDWFYVQDKAVVKGEFLKIGNYTYYFGVDGKMYANCSFSIWKGNKNDYYRVDENGHMITGWYEDDWETYYYGSDGRRASGLTVIDGETYYFNDELQRNYSVCVDGYLYYFGAEGKMDVKKSLDTNGWVQAGNDWYYVQDKALLKEQFVVSKGYTYYLGYDGKMYTDCEFSEWDEVTGQNFRYRVDKDGHLVTGWYTDEYKNKYYYGSDGRGAKGLTVIDGATYYFDRSMYTNRLVDVDGIAYYFGSDGKMTVKKDMGTDGWLQAGGDWYYVQDKTLLKNQFVVSKGYTYYLGYDGTMYTNCTFSVWDEDADYDFSYRVDKDGHLVTGWYIQGNNKYYYGSDGRMAEGLTEINGDTYYFADEMLTNYTTVLYGNLYYFGKDGKLTVQKSLSTNGWIQAGTYWYYAKNGNLARNVFIKSGDYTYYLGYDGRMYKNRVVHIDDEEGNIYAYRLDAEGHMVTGWYEVSGTRYYYGSDGRGGNGVQKVDGVFYYFDDSGEMRRNVSAEKEGTLYYFGANGKMQKQVSLASNGWKELPDGWYYAKAGKLVRSEWVKSGDHWYYIDNSGKMYTDTTVVILDSKTDKWYRYRFDENGYMVTGWYQHYGDWYYYDKNGHAAEGIVTVNNNKYYFAYEGCMQTEQSYADNGVLYYFGSDGKVAKQLSLSTAGWKEMPDGWYYAAGGSLVKGFKKIGNYTYFFSDENGRMRENGQVEIYNIDTDSYEYYRFDKNGHMVTGWYKEEYGNWYYYGENGCSASGILTVGGVKYYFGSNGRMYTEYSSSDKDNLYYFGADGKMQKQVSLASNGWKEMPDGWYYAMNGSLVRDEWITSKGKKYYMGYSGRMVTDTTEWVFDEDEDMEYIYRFDANGNVVTGWYQNTDGTWYYYGKDGRAAEGLQTVNGSKYYFGYEGEMMTSYTLAENGTLSYFGESGKLEKTISLVTDGWKELPNGWYYAENGTILRNERITLKGYTYYLDGSGVMVENREVWITDEQEGRSYRYRFDSNGHMITGWYQQQYAWYYYEADGRAANGLHTINNAEYYFESNGYMYVSSVQEINGTLYYFGDSGKAEKKVSLVSDGWKEMPIGWYYAKAGKLLEDQWLTVGGHTYYLASGGRMYTDTMSYIRDQKDGKTYLYRFNSNGYMVTGWYQDASSGAWYYYGSDGHSASGMMTVNGKKYYFGGDGNSVLINRAVYYDGKVYIADGNGVCTLASNGWSGAYDRYYMENGKAVTGWKKISDKWYYFSKDYGYKYTSGSHDIDGKNYYFDKNGVMKYGWIQQDDGSWLFADGSGVLVTDKWSKINGKQYYFDSDSKYVTGICEIDGKFQLFDKNGIWKKELTNQGNGWLSGDSDWYYFENGKAVISGTKMISGKRYAFDENGKMLKNTAEDRYYYGSSGAAVVNTWRRTSSNGWTYYDEEGKLVTEGWKKIKDSWYYFQNRLAVQSDRVIDGKLYHFAASGASNGVGTKLTNGWNLVDGYYYYYKNNDILKNTWATIGSDKYRFNYDGKMAFDTVVNDSADRYYVDKNGRMCKGWIHTDGVTYYAGADGKLVEGLQTISGKKYYFRDILVHSDSISLDGKSLYVIRDDVVIETIKASGTGWKQTSNGRWFYSENGSFAKGRRVINGKQYYFIPVNGAMMTNGWASGIGYAGADGVLKFNGWYEGRYFAEGRMAYGLATIGGKEYYFQGGMPMTGVYFDDSAYYSYDGKGGRTKVSLKEGWNKFNGFWYYVVDGKPVNSGFFEIDDKFYYFNYDGKMAADAFTDIFAGDTLYAYVDSKGLPVKGWKTINGNKYYFNSNGYALIGRHVIDGKTYIFNYQGALVE